MQAKVQLPGSSGFRETHDTAHGNYNRYRIGMLVMRSRRPLSLAGVCIPSFSLNGSVVPEKLPIKVDNWSFQDAG